jgi:hypothetical protein
MKLVLVCELWLLRQIPDSVLSDSVVARQFVGMMAHVMPVIHQLDRISSKPEVLQFFLALSPLLLLPKVILMRVPAVRYETRTSSICRCQIRCSMRRRRC